MLKCVFSFIFCLSLFLKDSWAVTVIPDSLIVSGVIIEGNYVTSEKFIFRELTFSLNDTVHSNEIEDLKRTSINNLVKTSLFNFVEIDAAESLPGFVKFTIKLTERWYIWPTGYLNHTDRNFSEWWRTKDLSKLEYGVGIKINNLRGMGETLLLNFRPGNFTRYEMEYRGLFLDKAKCHSLSFLTSWSAKKILPYVIESDKQVTLKENSYLIKSFMVNVHYKYRKGYFNTHNIELGYSDDRIADTIYTLNPYYAGSGRNRLSYFNLKYEFRRDNRDSHIYPKTGHLLVAGFNRKGLNMVHGEYNSTDIFVQFYIYKKVIKRFYVATGLWYHSVLDDEYVFSTTTGLGYLDLVRGYEYYAVNGDNAFLFKSLVKYEILPMKVINMKIWPIRNLHQFNRVPVEIYSNLFFDAGYVNDRYGMYKNYNSILVNKTMYSFGIGIDFVTYYDKVFRVDYSFNALGERGLFIHWKAAFR